MFAPATNHSSRPRAARWLRRIGSALIAIAIAIAIAAGWSGYHYGGSQDGAGEEKDTSTISEALPTSAQEEERELRVLVFFDPSHDTCAECTLHTWRFAYYTTAFRAEIPGCAKPVVR